MNPYNKDFPELSRDEMRLILAKIRIPQREAVAQMYSGRISLRDCYKETKVKRHALHAILACVPVTDLRLDQCVPKKRVRQLSRWLLMYECGMMKKVDGKILYLPEPTKAMPTFSRIALGPAGAMVLPMIRREAPTLMPGFKSLFSTAPTLPIPKR